MKTRFGGQNSRRVWTVLGVSLAHVALIGWLVTRVMTPLEPSPLDSVDVVFAERALPPIEPDPKPDPAQLDKPAEPDDLAPRSTPSVPAVSTREAQNAEPTVLTRLDPGEDAQAVEPASDSLADTEAVLDPQILSAVVQNLSCRDLKMHRSESCPKADPFEIALASEARQTAAPAAPLLIGDYGPKNALERFASQKDRTPYLMPGMSADLFSDGMADGAYNAARIRNGLSPLWDKEIERGFRRQD
ncbi:MAG: hypothetical protein AAF269_01430 [Pseudomonadota bacterium]